MLKSSSPTAAAITASFPIPVLSPITTKTSPPTYATIRLAQTQLNSNATTVPSHEGDGVHGHLALTLTPPPTSYALAASPSLLQLRAPANLSILPPPLSPPSQKSTASSTTIRRPFVAIKKPTKPSATRS